MGMGRNLFLLQEAGSEPACAKESQNHIYMAEGSTRS